MHMRAADTLSLSSTGMLDVGTAMAGGAPALLRPEVQAAVGTLMDAVARSSA